MKWKSIQRGESMQIYQWSWHPIRHTIKEITYATPQTTGTCGWNGTDDADDADGANAVGGLQKQYKILQERMGDRSRDRETNIEFV